MDRRQATPLPRTAHPLLERQLRDCLPSPRNAGDPGEPIRALASKPERLKRLLELVDGAYTEDDLYQARTFEALEHSFQKARETRLVEADRERTLQALRLEREQALAELERVRQAQAGQERLISLGALSSGFAQEIKAPLKDAAERIQYLKDAYHALMGVLEGMEGGAAAGEAADLNYLRCRIPAALREAVDALERAGLMVRSLEEYAVSRGDAKEPLDLNRTVEGILTLSRNEWKFVAEIETRLEVDLPRVPCVESEIRQVLLTLVVNAAQAVAQRRNQDPQAPLGRLVVGTSRERDWVRLTVADNGCGIQAEIAALVFDPYFTTKEAGKGSGQGLAVARELVTRGHRGTLTFESTPGHGTVFSLRLPLAAHPD